MGHAAHADRINSPSEFDLIRLHVGLKGLGQAMTD
jgi:hypothetical protein